MNVCVHFLISGGGRCQCVREFGRQEESSGHYEFRKWLHNLLSSPYGDHYFKLSTAESDFLNRVLGGRGAKADLYVPKPRPSGVTGGPSSENNEFSEGGSGERSSLASLDCIYY